MGVKPVGLNGLATNGAARQLAAGPGAQQPPSRTTLPIVPPPTGWLLGTVGGANTTKVGSGGPTSF